MLKNFFKNIISFWRKDGIDISYSRITAYQSCPWKYKLIYEDGMRAPLNPFMSFGLSIHKTLENFYINKCKSFEDLIETYDECWVNEGFTTPQQIHDFYEKGIKMLKDFYEDNKNLNTEIIYIEKKFRFKIGRHYLRGIIDRIDLHPDGTYEVIDYKTHSDIWSQNKVDTDLQINLYSLACEKLVGVAPTILSYYFIAHGRKLITSRSKESIKEAVKMINGIADKIYNKEFTPNSNYCIRCDFRKKCKYSVKK